MKKTKRFAAAVAALAMAFSMVTMTATIASAAELPTTTVSASVANTAHTFTAYPIFLGTIKNNSISNASLPTGGFTLDQIAAAAGVTGEFNQNDVLAEIEKKQSNSKEAIAFAKALAANTTGLAGEDITSEGTSLETGYYLIVEKNTVNNSVLNANILKVVGGTTLQITEKTSAPTLVKKVGEEKAEVNERYGNKEEYAYNDVADHSITEAVPFKLFGTMPSNIAMYDHYMYKITDTYDSQLTVDENSIVVSIDGQPVYQAGAAGSSFNAADHGLTVTVDATKHKIVVNFVDIKVYGVTATSQVTVEYNAALNATAKIADEYQENGAKLTYSRDFDSTVEWTPYESTQPNNPSPDHPNYPDTPKDSDQDNPNGDEETENSGDTPEDKVVLYTYELQIQKTDGTNPITGEAAQAAEFTVKQGDKYIAVDNDRKVSGFVDQETRIKLDENGKLIVIGLDDGTYTVTEKTPPTGYRLPDKTSFTVTIKGGIITMQDWDTFDATLSYNVSEQAITIGGDGAVNVEDANADEAGLYKANLENAAIGSLPTTGGIGTKIFVIGGGSIALASGVILIAKKRSKKEEQ